MLLTTIDQIPDKKYEVIGLVQGSIVQTKHIGRDIMAGFKTIVGGEIKGYTEMLTEARIIATQRMIQNALDIRADAIVCVRYSSANVMQNAAEILVFGTAVRFV